jgi:hypothetical protein
MSISLLNCIICLLIRTSFVYNLPVSGLMRFKTILSTIGNNYFLQLEKLINYHISPDIRPVFFSNIVS